MSHPHPDPSPAPAPVTVPTIAEPRIEFVLPRPARRPRRGTIFIYRPRPELSLRLSELRRNRPRPPGPRPPSQFRIALAAAKLADKQEFLALTPADQYLSLLRWSSDFIQHGGTEYFTCPDFSPAKGKGQSKLSKKSYHALQRITVAAGDEKTEAPTGVSTVATSSATSSHLQWYSRRFVCLNHTRYCAKQINPHCPANVFNQMLSCGEYSKLPNIHNRTIQSFLMLWKHDQYSVGMINWPLDPKRSIFQHFMVLVDQKFALVTYRHRTAQLTCRLCVKKSHSCIHIEPVKAYFKEKMNEDVDLKVAESTKSQANSVEENGKESDAEASSSSESDDQADGY